MKIEDVAVKEELAGSKRKAESEADDDAGDAPAPKAVKAEEGGEAAEDAAAEAGEEAAAAEGGAGGGDGGAQPPAEPEPVTVGYKTFASGKDAKAYYHGLISKLTKYQNLNDVRAGGLRGGRGWRWVAHAAAVPAAGGGGGGTQLVLLLPAAS